MPTYDYECPKCQKVYERLAKYDEKEKPCTECNNPTFKIDRIYTPEFVTKGAGFYSTGSAALKGPGSKIKIHEEFGGTMSPDWDTNKIHGIDK